MLTYNVAVSDYHVPDAEMQQHLQIAERDVTEARASYILRNKIVQDVLITDPILKAVHSGSNATRAERYSVPTSVYAPAKN